MSEALASYSKEDFIPSLLVAEMYLMMEEVLGTAHALFYSLSKKIGKKYAVLDENSDPFEGVMRFLKENSLVEEIEVVKKSENGIVFRLNGSPLSSRAKNANKPMDTMLAGFIAGWVQQKLGRRVEGKETKCVAMGHPYCEITLKFF